ncbi:protein of unknown function [Methanoculleus bourgensis]|jgi:hypothetical protein|uniref:Uncharacterized protein n=1 Tax=Methanoculleus bourgensis TaxID=83986 RepID=A0A0X3BPC2_9EURY|nr:protein of unknown function [Methanoculleus bourgensis]
MKPSDDRKAKKHYGSKVWFDGLLEKIDNIGIIKCRNIEFKGLCQEIGRGLNGLPFTAIMLHRTSTFLKKNLVG